MSITDFFKVKDKVDKLIDKLQSTDEEKRENALDVLSSMYLTADEGIKVLEAAKRSFPKSKFEWMDISSDLIDICANRPYSEYILEIENIYDKLNPKAKISALNFLSKYENEQALVSYIKLLEKDYNNMTSLPSGSLIKKPRSGDILFPSLLKFADNKSLAADIYLLLLIYFNNGLVSEEQIEASKAMIVNDIVDMSHKVMTFEPKDGNSISSNDEYSELRYAAGVYFDVAGYMNSPTVILALRNLMQVKDTRLKMYAAISLLRLRKTISPEDALEIAADCEVRNWFIINLNQLGKVDLFPKEYKTQKAFEESNMVDWVVSSAELGRAPHHIALMNIYDNEEEEDYLFNFKSDDNKDGVLEAVSGSNDKNEMTATSAVGYTSASLEISKA